MSTFSENTHIQIQMILFKEWIRQNNKMRIPDGQKDIDFKTAIKEFSDVYKTIREEVQENF